MVWPGMNENYLESGKDGCAIVLSVRLWENVTEHERYGSRIVWGERRDWHREVCMAVYMCL